MFQDFYKLFRFLHYFEELHIFERLWHQLHEKLHHVDLTSSLYDAKSGFPRSAKVWNISFSFFLPTGGAAAGVAARAAAAVWIYYIKHIFRGCFAPPV